MYYIVCLFGLLFLLFALVLEYENAARSLTAVCLDLLFVPRWDGENAPQHGIRSPFAVFMFMLHYMYCCVNNIYVLL